MRTDRTSIHIECRRKKETGKRGKVHIRLSATPPDRPKPALSPVGQLLAEKASKEEGQGESTRAP